MMEASVPVLIGSAFAFIAYASSCGLAVAFLVPYWWPPWRVIVIYTGLLFIGMATFFDFESSADAKLQTRRDNEAIEVWCVDHGNPTRECKRAATTTLRQDGAVEMCK